MNKRINHNYDHTYALAILEQVKKAIDNIPNIEVDVTFGHIGHFDDNYDYVIYSLPQIRFFKKDEDGEEKTNTD